MSRTVIAAVDDMFFASKIRATAESLGVAVSFVRKQERILSGAREKRPDLILVDLHSQTVDPLAIAVALKSEPDLQSIPLLGFFSHVRTDLLEEAREAGYDTVVPRSVFSRDLASILIG